MLNLEKTAHSCIPPVFLNENDFSKFILLHLWEGSRGSRSKLSVYRMFYYMLGVLYTGIQWKMLPVEKGKNGQLKIHHTLMVTSPTLLSTSPGKINSVSSLSRL